MHARPRSRRIVPTAALAAAALVLGAGCSDDGPKIDERADRRLVREVALTVDDLPDGFEEQDEEDDDDDNALDVCGEEVDIDPDEVEENRVAEAGRDTSFVLADEASFTQVAASVVALRDRDLALRQIEAFDDDDFFDCVVDGLEERVADGEDVTIGDVDTIDPAVEADAGTAISVELESGGFAFELQMHIVLVDRFGFTLQAFSGPDGVDDDLVEDAFDAMLERLEDEQG